MKDKDIIAIARVKLPLVVAALNNANLEAQKAKPDLDRLDGLLSADDVDGFYDLSELLYARRTFKKHSQGQN